MKTLPPPLSIAQIQTLLAPCCQPALRETASVVLLDAIENVTNDGSVALPPLFFSGFAGLGKTHAAELIAEALQPYGFEFIQIPIGCKSSVLAKILVDSLDSRAPVIFFLDEMHALKDQASKNLLKTVTETGGKVKEIRVQIGREEFQATVNPSRHLFIGASNEAIKDTALVGASGRFLDVQFLPYNAAGIKVLFDLLKPKYLVNTEITPEAEAVALRNVRPFARSIKVLQQTIRRQVKLGMAVGTAEGMTDALAAAGYIPGGWTKRHLSVLLFIDRAPRQVQEISNGPLMGSAEGMTQGLLSELMQASLIRTENGKKIVTAEGQSFLKQFKSKKK